MNRFTDRLRGSRTPREGRGSFTRRNADPYSPATRFADAPSAHYQPPQAQPMQAAPHAAMIAEQTASPEPSKKRRRFWRNSKHAQAGHHVKSSASGDPSSAYSTLYYLRLSWRAARMAAKVFYKKHRLFTRVTAVLLALLIVFGLYIDIKNGHDRVKPVELESAVENLVGKTVDMYAAKLTPNGGGGFDFNKGYTITTGDVRGQSAGPKINASFASAKTAKVTVTDPVNSVTIGLTPQFLVKDPKKQVNRVIYPIIGKNAVIVYSAKGTAIKEDIVVRTYSTDTMDFDYQLDLPAGTEPRMENNGSISIYSVNTSLMGNVTTGSEQDAQLLDKARQNGKKTVLLFTIPAPVILDGYKKVSKTAKARYTLNGTKLSVTASGLKGSTFPLSIDPSIYVDTVAQLMRGNNESNVDFDPTNGLIQKSQTTGARIDSWTNTSNLNTGVWGQGMAVAGGYIYSVGGAGGNSAAKVTDYTAGASTFVVPTGVTSITVKAWGAGGGGGGGNNNGAAGASGGGGGYAAATITTTPGETLDVLVGTAGAKATVNTGGGSGGGYSALKRTGTFLLQAGGGGGGGGLRGGGGGGGAGGAGGGASGVAGSNGAGGSNAGGGGAGTNAAGGGAGAAGTNGSTGVAGTANAGGNGSATATGCNTATTGTGGAGGTGAGGSGGTYTAGNCSNGGGGGGGRFGGGGGGTTNSNGNTGGGGGGGSDLVTGTGTTETAGSGVTPGNNGDADRSTAATGGTGGLTAAAATAGAAGAIVISYTAAGTTTPNATVSWAQFNTTTSAIASPNPGNGTCSGWCTNSAYDLPAARTGLSLVAYNGYLYAIGGSDSSNNPTNTVYIAKLGANGEPQLWHPSGGTPVYWYTDTNLSNNRSYFGAVAYNNHIYIAGGLTTSSTVLGSNTVQYADVKPTGVLTSWTTTGMTALTSARYGLSMQVYNDVIYVLGGDLTFSGSPITTVEYVKLNSDGTMNSWVATTSLPVGKMSIGGNFSTIASAYIYMGGGCTAVNGSGYCTAIATDVTLASINADGTVSEWNTIVGLTLPRIGYTLMTWQGGLYRLGGCENQNTSTGVCDSIDTAADYGVINTSGDASTVATSVASGSAPCSGGSPYGCDLPASLGNVLDAAVVMNGYLYIMGGCTVNNCGTVTANVGYTSIASDGTLTKPASCSGSYTDSYCIATNSLPSALGAPGTAIFNDRIYIVGGFTGGGATNSIYYSLIGNDGTVGAWSTTSLSGTGATSVSYTYAYARANPASAGSTPGNLYIFGGCTAPAGVTCGGQTQNVYKCTLSTTGVPAACSTTNQLQIGTVNTVNPSTLAVTTGAGTGVGTHSGAVYANYIYLMGGLGGGLQDITTVRYAKFNNSNNVVNASTGLSTGTWTEDDTHVMAIGRRRGAAFGYNGYLYVLGGYDGTGAQPLADIEFAKINVSDGSWGSFKTSAVSINKRWGLVVPVSNSYAYVVGGCTAGTAPSGCTTRTSTVQTFQAYNNDSGTVRTYTAASDDTFANSTDRWGASATVYNGYLYVAGGCTSTTDCTTAVSDVEYSPISKTDGSLGTWVAATNGLPAVRAWGKLVNVNGTLYYLGGQDSTSTNEQSTIYYVSTFTSGDITAAWSTATKAIGDTGGGGNARTKFGVAVWDSRIYVIGGLDGSAAVSSTVYVSPQLPSGGNITSNWASSTAFNVARYGGATTAYANNLYMFGGNDGTNYLNDGQFASIGYKTGTIAQSGTTVTGTGTTFTAAMVGSKLQYTDGSTSNITAFTSGTSITVDISRTVTAGASYTIQDGSVGTWSYTTSTPGYVSQGEAFGANGYMYVVGGRSATSSCAPKALVAPISANTTIATNNNPTGVGEWYETNTRFAGGRYGAAVAYNSGKLYVMGGGCTYPLGPNYTTGTIAQATNTITGTGTTWTDDLIGALITYQDATTATVVAVSSTTSIISSVSKTVTAGSTYTISSTRHYYGVLKAQPQMAKYSRLIDTDTDVFPNGWLLNGLDSSIGARWQTSYRTMHDINPLVVGGSDSVQFSDGTITQSGTTVTGVGTNFTSSMVGATIVYADLSTATISSVSSTTSMVVSVSQTIGSAQNYTIWVLQENPNEDCGTSSSMATMTTFGQNTNFGSTMLGLVNAYTPLNGSGGNINCARYYYFSINIDASQTFGYPEDVTRGPTITDLSLFFTSDPSKRLRHGKTFTGGEQQPLDTPCRVSGASPSGSQPNCPLP